MISSPATALHSTAVTTATNTSAVNATLITIVTGLLITDCISQKVPLLALLALRFYVSTAEAKVKAMVTVVAIYWVVHWLVL